MSDSPDAQTPDPSDSPATQSWFESADSGSDGGSAPGAIDSGVIGNATASLGGIIAIILLCAWALKKLGWTRQQAANRLNVVASKQLGKHERLVIVEADGQSMVLGVSQHSITRLDRVAEGSDAQAPEDPASFEQRLADKQKT